MFGLWVGDGTWEDPGEGLKEKGLHRQLGWQWCVLGLQLPWSLPTLH